MMFVVVVAVAVFRPQGAATLLLFLAALASQPATEPRFVLSVCVCAFLLCFSAGFVTV